MANNIALPDTYCSPDALNRVLNQQGYELCKRDKFLGLDVQVIRLIDVFFIAPVLIYTSTKEELPKPLRITLAALGVATLIYNGHHFLLNAKK
jgi:hypothetical protein